VDIKINSGANLRAKENYSVSNVGLDWISNIGVLLPPESLKIK